MESKITGLKLLRETKTKKCNDQMEVKRNVCSLNNANNEKPKNNENTCNNRNTNEAQQNYASNNQEQQ